MNFNRKNYSQFLKIQTRLVANTSTGCKIAGSGLGERNKSAKQIGEEAAQELINNVKAGGCVDEYLQDQLICKLK